jgi:hypothetical protein
MPIGLTEHRPQLEPGVGLLPAVPAPAERLCGRPQRSRPSARQSAIAHRYIIDPYRVDQVSQVQGRCGMCAAQANGWRE